MQLLKKLSRSHFIKNVAFILSGSIIAQLINLASMPILTRMYGTESFGTFGLFMAVFAIFATLSTGRYNLAIMLPKNDDDSFDVLKGAFIVLVIFTVLLLIFLPASKKISQWLDQPALAEYFIWLPVVVFFNGCYQILKNWLSRNKKFYQISVAIVVASVVCNLWRISYGFFNVDAIGLISSIALMFLFQAAWLFFSQHQDFLQRVKRGIDIRKIKQQLIHYRQMPSFRVPKDFLNGVTQNSPALILAVFFSADKVGFFYLVDRVIRVPSMLLGNAVRHVYFQKSAEIYNNGRDLYQATFRATLGMFLIGVVPFTIIIVEGPALFGFLFGGDWAVAGEYAKWIAVTMLFSFANVPGVVIVSVLKLEKFFLAYEVASIIIRISALLYGSAILKDDLKAVMLYALSGAVLNILLVTCVLYFAKTRKNINAS